MPQESETVTGNPETPQQQNADTDKDNVGAPENDQQSVQVSTEPLVQEDACILKSETSASSLDACPSPRRTSAPKSPAAEATEEFLLNEKDAYESVPTEPQVPEPRTPVNSEASESGAPSHTEDQQETTAPQVVEVSVYSETVHLEAPINEPITLNGNSSEQPPEEPIEEKEPSVPSEPEPKPEPTPQLTNGNTNGECKFEPRKTVEHNIDEKPQVLNGTIANELVTEDYKLPDVVEVKKNFEYIEPAGQNISQAPPKKGALATTLDSQSVKQAYHDVRHDGSETQWAVFKFQGATIVTSAKGTDFTLFKKEFGEDERAFGYIRVQTGDEMSRRAKFLLVTWVGPSVSVLKRAKMSTDKALIKDIVSNFAVELQTENISDIDLQNFETVLDKAAGAHYGTGVRS